MKHKYDSVTSKTETSISWKLKKVYLKDLYCTIFVNIDVYDITKLKSERCITMYANDVILSIT